MVRPTVSAVSSPSPTSCWSAPVQQLLGGVRSVPLAGPVRPDLVVHGAGDASLLLRPCVAVVGSRDCSPLGAARAMALATNLVDAGVVVVSGMARGIDSYAIRAALAAGGRCVGVLGTPLSRVYPPEGAGLQRLLGQGHLLVTPFGSGVPVRPSNFPQRNRVMAALADATIIVEAADDSGTLYQAQACGTLGRWLFLPEPVATDPSLAWPRCLLGLPHVRVFDHPAEVLGLLRARAA